MVVDLVQHVHGEGGVMLSLVDIGVGLHGVCRGQVADGRAKLIGKHLRGHVSVLMMTC